MPTQVRIFPQSVPPDGTVIFNIAEIQGINFNGLDTFTILTDGLYNIQWNVVPSDTNPVPITFTLEDSSFSIDSSSNIAGAPIFGSTTSFLTAGTSLRLVNPQSAGGTTYNLGVINNPFLSFSPTVAHLSITRITD
ncbi:hypothetical protein NW801_18255 [Brevibacillus laterosporus]|uniref:Exosporium leader peptide n=1 Tax=Brevibacillus halotolerans TaxID=1507437 RepID=A0ABT4I0W5_9BACL|nr:MULTISPECIES: hypothetical protein [Brevibacillus]MCR8986963.1 hypothetical protein [Brevibacillus laterosporus]MCZ0832699.1 hypothetical protein [Brevibacillus halotolerans]